MQNHHIHLSTAHSPSKDYSYYDLVCLFFNDLREIFVQAGVLDSINKFSFYQQLAEAASETIERNPAVEAAELCRKVVEKAESIYQGME